MNCNNYRKLIPDYEDGLLSDHKLANVDLHIRSCKECGEFARDVRNIATVLHDLPTAQTSRQFDGRLASRIAEIPARKRQILSDRMGWLLRNYAMRPALAMGAAAAITGGVFFWWHPITQTDASAAPDRVLVTHCVQQHRNYVGAQPLSDIAAQNLANQLDQTSLASSAVQMPGEGGF